MVEGKEKKEAQKVMIKEEFKERYKKILKEEYEEFMKYSFTYIRKAIRVNTLKISREELKKRLEKRAILEPVPWYENGFWIKMKEERYDIGNIPEHTLGYFYVQDPASMIPVIALDPKEDETILDIAAAPGSKTTQIAQHMNNKGMIIANEPQLSRIKALSMNLQRCGVMNTVITRMEGQWYKNVNKEFDRVLVDAPCTGTGTIRKSFKVLQMWSPKLVKRMSKIQKQLLKTAFERTKEGGIIVYSTCTLEPEENEEVIDWLLKEYPNAELEEININIKRSPPILEWEGKKYDERIKKVLRIYPQDNDTEGFFIARIKKKALTS